MAKFKTNMQQKKKDLVAHDIPLPESAHEAIRDESPKIIQIRFSPETLKKAGQIADSLLISRKISEPATINQNHEHVMYLGVLDKERPTEDIIYEVQYYHRKWNAEVQRDAGFIALTLLTKLKDIDPTPYTPEDFEDEPEEGEELEDWEGKRTPLPIPPRNLKNPYERRLKQFLDMLELTDLIFQVNVGKKLNDIFIDALRTYGDGDVSDERFQPTTISGRTDAIVGTVD